MLGFGDRSTKLSYDLWDSNSQKSGIWTVIRAGDVAKVRDWEKVGRTTEVGFDQRE
jgi:hypothetical protein